MTDPLTINVTQAHIDRGVPRRCRYCPITLAMEAAGYGGQVKTSPDDVHWSIEDEYGYMAHFRSSLPPNAVDFVRAFDGHFAADPESAEPVEPFTFTLGPVQAR